MGKHLCILFFSILFVSSYSKAQSYPYDLMNLEPSPTIAPTAAPIFNEQSPTISPNYKQTGQKNNGLTNIDDDSESSQNYPKSPYALPTTPTPTQVPRKQVVTQQIVKNKDDTSLTMGHAIRISFGGVKDIASTYYTSTGTQITLEIPFLSRLYLIGSSSSYSSKESSKLLTKVDEAIAKGASLNSYMLKSSQGLGLGIELLSGKFSFFSLGSVITIFELQGGNEKFKLQKSVLITDPSPLLNNEENLTWVGIGLNFKINRYSSIRMLYRHMTTTQQFITEPKSSGTILAWGSLNLVLGLPLSFL